MADTIHELSVYAQQHGEPYSRWASDWDAQQQRIHALQDRIAELEHALRVVRDESYEIDTYIYDVASEALMEHGDE